MTTVSAYHRDGYLVFLSSEEQHPCLGARRTLDVPTAALAKGYDINDLYDQRVRVLGLMSFRSFMS